MSSCPDCRSGIDHCHGTLVLHSDGTFECTDPGCELGDTLRHAYVIDCSVVLGGCCSADGRIGLAEAS
jgi:hypothetical protein